MRSFSLEAKGESEEYTLFGLGYGVDASDPSPLRCKHGKVRVVLPDLSNVEETTKKERKRYEEIIASIVTHSASVNLSVSDVVAKALTVSAEGEFSRERSKEMIASGRWIFVFVQRLPNKACSSNLLVPFKTTVTTVKTVAKGAAIFLLFCIPLVSMYDC